jgi:pantetheine-phosphate adenylyltransferase
MSKLVGFYPGSFDPVTNGHVDVIERACKLVNTLYIGIGNHHKKAGLLSDADRRILLEKTAFPIGKRAKTKIEIVDFDGLMIEAARRYSATLIIRGLRDTTDYNYEMQMVGMNSQMAPDLQTVFIPSSPHVRHISASLVRQIAQMDGDISAFVPALVLKALG